jgi:hypothetical protein
MLLNITAKRAEFEKYTIEATHSLHYNMSLRPPTIFELLTYSYRFPNIPLPPRPEPYVYNDFNNTYS